MTANHAEGDTALSRRPLIAPGTRPGSPGDARRVARRRVAAAHDWPRNIGPAGARSSASPAVPARSRRCCPAVRVITDNSPTAVTHNASSLQTLKASQIIAQGREAHPGCAMSRSAPWGYPPAAVRLPRRTILWRHQDRAARARASDYPSRKSRRPMPRKYPQVLPVDARSILYGHARLRLKETRRTHRVTQWYQRVTEGSTRCARAIVMGNFLVGPLRLPEPFGRVNIALPVVASYFENKVTSSHVCYPRAVLVLLPSPLTFGEPDVRRSVTRLRAGRSNDW